MATYVNNLQDRVEVPPELEGLLLKVAAATLERAGRAGTEAGITLADDNYLQELNREYRGIDAPTDVLSFALSETGPCEPVHGECGPELLGDVVISMEKAAAQAGEYGHSLRREVAYLAVHGLLHLLGYDHDRAENARLMRAAEEEILGTCMNE